MVRPDGWYLAWVTKDGNKLVNGKGEAPASRYRDCVVLRNKKAIEKTNPTTADKSK